MTTNDKGAMHRAVRPWFWVTSALATEILLLFYPDSDTLLIAWIYIIGGLVIGWSEVRRRNHDH